jgi:V-type H+-transporting ATPase subunit a
MGFFATFCGFCYNDYTSVPIYLFGDSCYTFTEGEPIADLKPDCVYPIGVDPAWFLSVQELTFMNSLKMKMAVIFGVAQMSLGIILKGTNTIQNRSMVDFIFEFVPQILVLIALFGYMDLMIVLKWLQDWEGRTAYAPSVISTMIDMFLNMGKPSTPTDAPIFDTWEKQTEIELTLLMVVAICVPAMLLVKPILLSLTASKTKHDSHVEVHADDDFKAVENLADKYDIKDNIIKSAGD